MKNLLVVLITLAATFSIVDGYLKPVDESRFDSRRTARRDRTDGRLPRQLLPYHYDLDITPDFYSEAPPFPFTGTVSIALDCVQATDVLTLNSHGLTISEVSVVVSPDDETNPPAPDVIDWVLDAEADFLLVSVSAAFVPGAKYVATISFSGIVNSYELGLYWDSYQVADGTTRYILATQMESIGAREMFPSFDEPDLKATFSITVAHSMSVLALSNMPVIRTEQRPNGWIASVYDVSPIMSTYQVCICIGDFRHIEANWEGVVNYPVRVYARPEIIDQMPFAASIAPQIQKWLEDRTDIAYPLPKMDHIVLPSKGGAMENWGLITYGEDTLVFNPETSLSSGTEFTGLILSHELAHQWFGNLVTAKWWDDIWLNEGFASFFNFRPTESIGWSGSEPAQREIQDFMTADQKNTSDPVRKQVNTPWEAGNAFSGSTYPKGGAMGSFLQGILGEASFNAGITRYLNAYSYSSATTDDLWQVLTAQATDDGFELDVKSVMDPWLNQIGLPLVTIVRSVDGTARVTQNQLLHPPNQEMKVESPWNYKWPIPLKVVTASSDSAEWDGRPTDWLNINDTEVILTGLPTDPSEWIILNPKQRLYYRVLYDEENHAALVAQLLQNHTKLDVLTRSQFIDDSFTIARASYIAETAAMETTRYLDNELLYNPWYAALKYTTLSKLLLSSVSWEDSFSSYLLSKISPVFNTLGWTYLPGETPDEQSLRRDIVAAACDYGLSTCLDLARADYARFVAAPSINSVNPNNLPTVLCTGVSEGTVSDWAIVYDQYTRRRTSQVSEERYTYLLGMACTKDDGALDVYLAYIVRGIDIAPRDQYRATLYLSQNPLGAEKIWSYFDNSWDTVPSRMNKFTILRRISETFATQEELDKLNSFIEKHPPQSDAQWSQYNQMTLTVQQNINWLSSNQDSLRDWLTTNSPAITLKRSSSRLPLSISNYWRSMSAEDKDRQRL